MILRVRSSGGSIQTVSKILTLNYREGTDSINLEEGADNGITVSSTVEDYDAWYTKFIGSKKEAIAAGGSSFGLATENGVFTFSRGIGVYTNYGSVEASATNRPYIKSISLAPPDSSGNIQLLPSHTLDVAKGHGNTIELSRIEAESNPDVSYILDDINRCIWYLYHTFNSFLYRINIFDPSQRISPMFPERRTLGLLLAYQSVIAAWNAKVWRKSFLFGINPLKETVSFYMGYVALNCNNPDVRLRAVITNNSAYDTTKFYTVYLQGVASNIKSTKTVSITKYAKSGAAIQLDGNGLDGCVAINEDWSKIVIDIPLGRFQQGDYYKAALSLALSWDTSANVRYGGVDSNYHTIKIDTYWIFDGNESIDKMCKVTNNVNLRCVTLIEGGSNGQTSASN
jgi:hypothetical protein